VFTADIGRIWGENLGNIYFSWYMHLWWTGFWGIWYPMNYFLKIHIKMYAFASKLAAIWSQKLGGKSHILTPTWFCLCLMPSHYCCSLSVLRSTWDSFIVIYFFCEMLVLLFIVCCSLVTEWKCSSLTFHWQNVMKSKHVKQIISTAREFCSKCVYSVEGYIMNFQALFSGNLCNCTLPCFHMSFVYIIPLLILNLLILKRIHSFLNIFLSCERFSDIIISQNFSPD